MGQLFSRKTSEVVFTGIGDYNVKESLCGTKRNINITFKLNGETSTKTKFDCCDTEPFAFAVLCELGLGYIKH